MALSLTFKKYENASGSADQNNFIVRTGDIDFGEPELEKRIYGVYITYKSSAAQTQPVSYVKNNPGVFSSVTKFTGDFDITTNWKVLNATTTPFNAQSIAIEVKNVTAAGTIDINNIIIEYRTIYKRAS